MNIYPNNLKLRELFTKGGLMLFTIHRSDAVYKGEITLLPVVDCFQKRVVHIREYLYRGNDGKEE